MVSVAFDNPIIMSRNHLIRHFMIASSHTCGLHGLFAQEIGSNEADEPRASRLIYVNP
jgi:hypothetical protein